MNPSSSSSNLKGSEESVAHSTSTSHEGDFASKLKTLLGILRRFVGVPDIASVRFSLPSQLLEPIPNLEYWNYLDRPETFASIGDSEDELGRFLAVLRFWFTKDLKFIKGKPCKPYNSTLGEFFRCSWEITDLPLPPAALSRPSTAGSQTKTNESQAPVRVCFLTEQTSHHPPISAFVIECLGKGITARGYDQISAKFTGTSIRVSPGAHNLGIFITIHSRGDEMYRLTHPAANLGGFLKGSLSIYVQDVCYVTCSKTKLKAILHYLGDAWYGKAKHRVEGLIYRCVEEDDGIEKLKDVPKEAICAKIEGSWMGALYYTFPNSDRKHLLVDLEPLFPVKKTVPPQEYMPPNESQKVWDGVTKAILAKDYPKATEIKQGIEERQREKAAARLTTKVEWKPVFFKNPAVNTGQPALTKLGEEVMKRLHEGQYRIDDIVSP